MSDGRKPVEGGEPAPRVRSADTLDALHARRSCGRLLEPAPCGPDLDTLLAAAEAAPDHGRLHPWRFRVLAGEQKVDFGTVLADAYEARCLQAGDEPDGALLAKERTKLGRAPLVVVAGCVPVEGPIPEIEQVLAVGAAVENLLLAATALGYGSMWRTGDAAYDPRVKEALGLRPTDHIVGFVYLGTAPTREAGR